MQIAKLTYWTFYHLRGLQTGKYGPGEPEVPELVFALCLCPMGKHIPRVVNGPI